MNNKGFICFADIYLSRDYTSKELLNICESAILKSNMTIAKKVKKEFQPSGLTCLWLLEESHFSIHTYPEHKYISVDCYTCGSEGDPVKAVNSLIEALEVVKFTSKLIPRGV